ncbi:MAG: RNA polymerase sigma-70 factor [Cytophagales bacterium]|nr:RNA polymerase sigma-70 factor [Cytophagales bacterium]
MLVNLNHSDKELLQKVMQGCEKSFELLFKKYHGFLYHYTFRVFRDESIADEVVHKTFIKIWELKETLADIRSFKSYIFSINRSLVVEELRTISRNRRLAERLAQRIVRSHNSVEDEVIYNDLEALARRAVEQLPAKRREIFKLSRNNGYSHKEIAQKLNISENTVKVSVHKSLKQIRDYMSVNANISFSLAFSFMLLKW